MPGLNAAFVNIGYEKDAFIHYLDLGPQFTSLHKLVGTLTSREESSSVSKHTPLTRRWARPARFRVS